MDRTIIKQWVEALRSGAYKQGTAALKAPDNEGSSQYCCLGVLCDLHSKAGLGSWAEPSDYSDSGNYQEYVTNNKKHRGFLPEEVANWVGFTKNEVVGTGTVDVQVYLGPEYTPTQNDLSTLNDSGYTFERIAELIEMNFLSGEHNCQQK